MQVAGQEYSIGKMTPREQFHVMRRLGPIVGSMGSVILVLLDDGADKEQSMKMIANAVGPLTDALAYLPDELVDYVLDTCLTHVKRMDTDAGSPIYIKQPRGPATRMYQDIDGMTELKLVAEVIKTNLSGFFGQLSGASASPLSAPVAARASST